jgi:hypothetical protein
MVQAVQLPQHMALRHRHGSMGTQHQGPLLTPTGKQKGYHLLICNSDGQTEWHKVLGSVKALGQALPGRSQCKSTDAFQLIPADYILCRHALWFSND